MRFMLLITPAFGLGPIGPRAATAVHCSATACLGLVAGQIVVVIASAAASSLSSARFADIFKG